MADTFQLEIATPEHLIVDEQVTEASIPGNEGQMGILAGHAPLLGVLGAGVVSYNSGGQTKSVAVDGGFIEIFNDRVSVLAEYAEHAEEVKVDEARAQLEQARGEAAGAGTEEATEAALAKSHHAQAWIDAADGRS